MTGCKRNGRSTQSAAVKLLCTSMVLTIANVEAWVSPPCSTSAGQRAEASRLCAERSRYENFQYDQSMNDNGEWNENSFQEQPPENQWNREPIEQYEGQDVGYNNVNYYEPNQQYDAQYQPSQEYNNGQQQYPGEPMNQEFQEGPQQYQQPPPPPNQDFNNGQQYEPQFQGGPDQRFFSDYPPPNQGFNEAPNGAYDGQQPYPPSQQQEGFDRQQQPAPFDYREQEPGQDFIREDERYPARRSEDRLSRSPSSAFSLLDEMFDDPFFDDPFFENFFSMPTPFSMLSPFYRTRRRGGSSSSMGNSNFRSSLSMLGRMREKMEDFSNKNSAFFQRVEESNSVLLSKAERYLNDDVACRMALGIGTDDRIRLGPILGSSSSMAYASVFDNGQEKHQERRDQRNLKIAVDGGSDPRMEAMVKLTAFGDGEIQNLTLLTRDGREISVPVIGRDNGNNNNGNGNFDDGRYLNEDRREGAPPAGVIDAEVVKQGR